MIYKQNPAFFVDFSRKKKLVNVSKHTYRNTIDGSYGYECFFLDRDARHSASYILISASRESETRNLSCCFYRLLTC